MPPNTISCYPRNPRTTRDRNPAVGANATIREMKGTAEPHDGLLEMWWDNAATLMDKAGSDSAADLRAQVQALEAQFIDIDRSNLFFTDG